MGYLLTAGVLGFQALIFVTIVGAGAIGRGKLWLVTAGWVAFTLFGSIFTAGLLLLQLLTIAVSYAVGSAAAGRSATQPEVQTVVVPPKTEEPGSSGYQTLMNVLMVGGILWLVYHFGGQTKQAAPTHAVRMAPVAPVEAQADSAAVKAKPTAASRNDQASKRIDRKNHVTSDFRHCLSLKTNQEIAKCAERAK